MSGERENFLDELANSLSSDSFIKLTLSNYKGADRHLQKVSARMIETKRGRQFSIQNQYETRQTVKNHPPDQASKVIGELIDSGFRSAHLFSTAADFQLTIGKRNSHLRRSRPTFSAKPATEHDRKKEYLIDPSAPYLKALGITTDDGRVRAQQQDKWRQINKYVEVLADLLERSSLGDKQDLAIVDMGSGKGYLTFAAYDYFANVRGREVSMTGVEMREDLVELCNQVAEAVGFEGLRFKQGSIDDFDVGNVDILIALHACDTATDDALYKGISAEAEIIVAAPCCHKEIRRQIKPPDVLKDVLKHGTMLEREAETVTDGIRAMLLEEQGYRTRVFEFVPVEHTPKNNMIVATRASERRIRRDSSSVPDLMNFYSIRSQRLETLLRDNEAEQDL